jgi:hypothetical protein
MLTAVTLVIVLLVALPSVAHHGTAQIYDSQSIMTIKGTVSEVYWGNPHAYVKVAVKNGTKADEWVVELGSTFNLVRMGWERDRAKVGDPVTIMGWRGKPAKNLYLGATGDPSSGLPRLLRLKEADFVDGSKFTITSQ